MELINRYSPGMRFNALTNRKGGQVHRCLHLVIYEMHKWVEYVYQPFTELHNRLMNWRKPLTLFTNKSPWVLHTPCFLWDSLSKVSSSFLAYLGSASHLSVYMAAPSWLPMNRQYSCMIHHLESCMEEGDIGWMLLSIGHIEFGSGDTPPVKCACKPFVLGLEDGGLARWCFDVAALSLWSSALRANALLRSASSFLPSRRPSGLSMVWWQLSPSAVEGSLLDSISWAANGVHMRRAMSTW